ncbi:unnamed protein product, partial [Schistocephalus solidus]|uniref:Aldedh domain-containing protein n=1 Tax=Schistocephalus solidus TaxID=70667 RepID=A0A183TCI8_SCHSO
FIFFLFIGNEFVESRAGKTFPVIDPSTEAVICQVQEADAEDVDIAVKSARKAFALNSPWRTMDASQRGRLLYKLSDAIEENIEYLTRLEAMDAGKPLDSARGDIEFAVRTFRYFAGFADKLHGKVIPADGDVVCWTRREPVGVVGAIIPWNYPLDIIALKLAPALCCGCTVVVKPAEETPLSALFLGSLIKKVGFPPGVVNILPGFGETAGSALARHPHVNAVTFTGSTAVGRLIMQAAATNVKRLSLELGGKSPLIVFADADLHQAAEVAHEEVMGNAGQCCVAATRTYVEASIYDDFVERLKVLAEKRTVGDPFETKAVQGPQINQVQFDKILKYIELGKSEGARLVTGGHRVGQKGFFVAPTVFADVRDEMTIAREEIFGPVQVVIRFDTMEEVIARANDTFYGLGAGVFTSDMDKAMRMSEALQAGTVW